MDSTNPQDRELREMLAALGIDPRHIAIEPLGGGWSGNPIVRITPAEGGALVLRILPGSDTSGLLRETAIHRLVRTFGVPAPEVIAAGPVSAGLAMVMPLMPGIPLIELLLGTATDAEASAWGSACGTMLARIHAIPADALIAAGIATGSTDDPAGWLAWSTPSQAVQHGLEPWLDDPAFVADRLLHLDFHPANLLGDQAAGRITAVLDWTNARIGPPLADLARTRSILRLATVMGLPSGSESRLAAFESGLLTAWSDRHGTIDPAMLRSFDTWALDVQIADLTPKLRMDGAWVTERLLADLRTARDTALAATWDDRKR